MGMDGGCGGQVCKSAGRHGGHSREGRKNCINTYPDEQAPEQHDGVESCGVGQRSLESVGFWFLVGFFEVSETTRDFVRK